jgi:hypothetical protein
MRTATVGEGEPRNNSWARPEQTIAEDGSWGGFLAVRMAGDMQPEGCRLVEGDLLVGWCLLGTGGVVGPNRRQSTTHAARRWVFSEEATVVLQSRKQVRMCVAGDRAS